VFIDFSCIPTRVVATYRNSFIKPDVLADEIVRQAEMYGECVSAREQLRRGCHYKA
jgi:hypothetical protein